MSDGRRRDEGRAEGVGWGVGRIKGIGVVKWVGGNGGGGVGDGGGGNSGGDEGSRERSGGGGSEREGLSLNVPSGVSPAAAAKAAKEGPQETAPSFAAHEGQQEAEQPVAAQKRPPADAVREHGLRLLNHSILAYDQKKTKDSDAFNRYFFHADITEKNIIY